MLSLLKNIFICHLCIKLKKYIWYITEWITVSNEKFKFHKNLFLCVKNLCSEWANIICILSQFISSINLFSTFIILKLLIISSAFWKSSYRMSEYNGQSIKKWISFSTEFVLQNLQSLSFRICGLEYLTVSTANGSAPLRNNAIVHLVVCGSWHDM